MRCKCLLLTQSGHGRGLSQCMFEPLRCLVLSLGGGNEAARFYQSCCRLSGSVSVCGPRTAARPHTAHRRALGLGRGRSGHQIKPRGIPAAVAATGLDRRPQCADRLSLCRRQVGKLSQICSGTGRAGSGRHSGLWHFSGANAPGHPHGADRVCVRCRSGRLGPGRKSVADRAAMPPASCCSNTICAQNGWSCSKRSRRA